MEQTTQTPSADADVGAGAGAGVGDSPSPNELTKAEQVVSALNACVAAICATLIVVLHENFSHPGAVVPVSLDGRLSTPLSESSPDYAQKLAQAWENFDGLGDQLSALVELQIAATETIPRTPYAATMQLADAMRAYEDATDEHLANIVAWQALDSQTGRTRERVKERLMNPGKFGLGDDVKALAPTAAKDAVSGDPEYTTLRDAIADASIQKEASALNLELCRQRVETAREMLRTIVAAKAANAPILVKLGDTEAADDALARRRAARGPGATH